MGVDVLTLHVDELRVLVFVGLLEKAVVRKKACCKLSVGASSSGCALDQELDSRSSEEGRTGGSP